MTISVDDILAFNGFLVSYRFEIPQVAENAPFNILIFLDQKIESLPQIKFTAAVPLCHYVV